MYNKELKIKTLSGDKIPYSLRQLPQPPEQLQVLGTLPDFDKVKILTVVGAREITTAGIKTIEKLLLPLSKYPIVIVSGLALGTDAHAHKVAIKAGLPTLAFPGSGLSKKVLYPKTNFALALEILKHGGALVSEFDFEQTAGKWTFPKRNRLMAGISDAVLVIEAQEKSGTLITARLATEYNKELLSVPGDIFADNYKGNNMLIKLGAIPVTEHQDILRALNIAELIDEETEPETPQDKYMELTDSQKSIMRALCQPMIKDELMQKSGLDATSFAIAFSTLELQGLIEERLGKVFKV